MALCKEWTTALPNPVENQPVTGSTPTLLLSGEYDPITPPSWAQATAAHLTHSYYFEIPAVGHGVAQGGNCPVGLMLEFLHDPAQQPDAACISRMDSAPDFVIRAAVTRRPVSFVTLGLGLVLAVLVVQVGLHFWRTPLFPFTLWHSFRQLNLIPLAIGVGLALVLILAKSSSEMASLRPEQITATLLPVIAAIQAAFLFSPED